MVLRKKIITASLLFGAILSVVLIGIFYRLLTENFEKQFMESKLSLARALALSIDGDIHRRIAETADTQDTEYQRYVKIFANVASVDKQISYAYTIQLDRRSGKLVYVIDGGVADRSRLWLENELFGAQIQFDDDGRLGIDFNGTVYTENFRLKREDQDYGELTFTQEGDWTHIAWDGQPFFSAKNDTPAMYKVGDAIVDKTVRPFVSNIKWKGRDIQNDFYYSEKGDSDSTPGDEYNDNEETLQMTLEALRGSQGFIRTQGSIYGEVVTAYGVIKNSRGDPEGLVMIDIYHKAVEQFKRKFLKVAAAISVPLIGILFVLTYIGSERLITRRLQALDKGVSDITRRDFKTRITVSGNDELSRLAAQFNAMASEIDSNTELLEQRIEERTRSLNQRTQELIDTQQKLVASEKMAAMGVFTAGMAHEINNPANFVSVGAQNATVQLVKLRGFVTDLLSEDADPEIVLAFNEYFDRIEQSNMTVIEGVRRIETVIRRLRADHPEGDVGMEEADVIASLESAWRVLAPSVGVQVSVQTDFAARPSIACRIADLHQVFLAVLSNAAHAIEDIVSMRVAGRIVLASRVEQGQLVVTVQDDGAGISDAIMDKLFDPFFTTKAVGRGAGLGLSMARSVMRAHGGDISVESVEYHGTCVTLRLPLRTAEVGQEGV